MPKVLLINPIFNIPKENYDSSISVGLLCLASYLDEKGISVKIIDGARQKKYLELIKKELPDADFVGISVMTTQVGSALEISKLVKDFKSDLPIIWGGLHPTFFPKETIRHPLIDVVVMGEGEKPLLKIVQNQPLNVIGGIAYKTKDGIKINPEEPFIDMNILPLPKWQIAPEEILKNLALVPTHTSRGCPHQCAFCVNAIRKNRWRARRSEQVLKDLEVIKAIDFFKDKPIRFWDEDFFVNKERSREIIKGMIERNFNLRWETTIRADYIGEYNLNDDFLADLKKSGCYLLSFGAESGSPKILKKINKGISPEQIIHSAKQCLKYDIIPQYSFMVGLPSETREDIFDTLRLIDKLTNLSSKVQILGPQTFRPYPGSSLYNECLVYNWRAPDSLDEWSQMIKNEINFLSPRNFPWLKNPDFVESLEPYVRFGAHSIKNAMGSTVNANKLLKLGFILLCKLRWKMKFFSLPWDYKLAKKIMAKN